MKDRRRNRERWVFKFHEKYSKTQRQKISKSVKEQITDQAERKQAENANDRGEYCKNDCSYYNYH